ncbi:sulfite exporter TauE/SafE family protein [Sphingomicrobium sediminis]|uniref:Probable membrane transporter protein n=1 Tax=Sphingomicrobium sediminis TaxID=2950949 RepID=A0A9X2EF56_9SPHN|nr:sulfite exporter TauE/SafE family protein [Sphingomicrobium sediminis]MCM8556281.1 sulfite exporter TauE/SafE family protein [Sphingomicrobium sediminis]
MPDLIETALALFSGGLVGFSLGLIGGGGSILAVPLLLYLVGMDQPHKAIGTSALAVAANAAIGLAGHARAGNVRWREGLIFALAGVLGAAAGSSAGKAFNGQGLLFLFAILMIVIAALMLKRGDRPASDRPFSAMRLFVFGLVAGMVAGFFGIGGGFIIVPALIAASSISMLSAVGTSLVAVTAFGFTTAGNYALSGLVDWWIAGLFVVGGFVGSFGGTRMAKTLSDKGALTKAFAGIIVIVALYMLWQSGSELGLI